MTTNGIGIELAKQFCDKIKERFKEKNKSLAVLSPNNNFKMEESLCN